MADEPQLTLPLCRPPAADFDQFIASANEVALHALRAYLSDAPRQPLFFLAGEPGSGKTHLLTAACAELERHRGRAVYVPLDEADQLAPALLNGLESCDLVCLDDLDAVAGLAEWEEAVFHLFNRLREAGQRLLISARTLPAKLSIALPDLRSRLQWGASFRLRSPDDDIRARILKERAARRGMPLDDHLIAYLLKRHDRDTASLIAIIERLDQLSLARKKPVTLPLLREVLTERDA